MSEPRDAANDAGSDAPSRRGEILREATELFLEEGYAGTSMSALARACGVQKATLYHHFPSKEALFEACVTEGYDHAMGELRRVRDDARLGDEERLRRAVAEIYRITIDAPVGRMSPLIAEVSLRFPELARAFHDGFIQREHDILHAIVDRGVANGSFRRRDRLALEQIVFGPVVTLSLSRQMFASFGDLDERLPVARIRDAHTEMLLELLRPDTAGAARPAANASRRKATKTKETR